MIHNFDELLAHSRTLPQKRVLVMYPTNEESFAAIREAMSMGLADFTLVGDEQLIRAAIPQADGFEIVAEPTLPGAVRKSIDRVRSGDIDILMKGNVDTSTMMKAVLEENAGIRAGRLLSDIFLMEFAGRAENRFVMITDGGMTLAPNLMNKVELIQNAVEVAHALGNMDPKVAILSATEFVSPKLQSTLDAAALTKMNERGQIRGCTVDGPLALDTAVSVEAAEEKRLKSPVAGHAEILVAANIESANSLAKSTTYFAGLRLAHVIVGGTVPVLIPSRADKSDARLLSIALGIAMSDYAERVGQHARMESPVSTG
jgi:phosphate butyryltransferase